MALSSQATRGRILRDRYSEDHLPRRADHRYEPHPLTAIRQRAQLLAGSARTREAGHAIQQPADLAEGLVAVPADRILAPATPRWAGSCLGRLAVLVDPHRWHGDGIIAGGPGR